MNKSNEVEYAYQAEIKAIAQQLKREARRSNQARRDASSLEVAYEYSGAKKAYEHAYEMLIALLNYE